MDLEEIHVCDFRRARITQDDGSRRNTRVWLQKSKNHPGRWIQKKHTCVTSEEQESPRTMDLEEIHVCDFRRARITQDDGSRRNTRVWLQKSKNHPGRWIQKKHTCVTSEEQESPRTMDPEEIHVCDFRRARITQDDGSRRNTRVWLQKSKNHLGRWI